MMRYNAKKDVIPWSEFWTAEFIGDCHRRVKEKYERKQGKMLTYGLAPPLRPPKFQAHTAIIGRPKQVRESQQPFLRDCSSGGFDHNSGDLESFELPNDIVEMAEILSYVVNEFDKMAKESNRPLPPKVAAVYNKLPMWFANNICF
ncbi:hypothetical protein HDU79_011709 [Rhizoclosmatium sp. JEL0117]|nr:hypothetical protein HDU79_011709 [Rhizoclosmatium sp. JEL0117]